MRKPEKAASYRIADTPQAAHSTRDDLVVEERHADRPDKGLPEYLQDAMCSTCRFYHPGYGCEEKFRRG